MLNILLYISMGLVILGFFNYLILILIGKNSVVTKSDGFDVTKDIISLYNSINVIENKSYFTVYNIKRKVIKLSTNCYYGKDLSSVSLSLIEAGISVIDNMKNKYLDILRNIFNNIKLLYIFPILSLFINNSSFYVSDAKVSIVFLLIFTFITYILLDIRSQAVYWVSENLNKINDISKENCSKIINFLNKFIICDKLIFFGELIMIFRLILIMFEII